MRSDAMVAALRASHLFGGADDRLLLELASRTERRRWARGDYVWRARSPACRFVIIASGLVKIVRPAPDGTDTIVGIFGPRQSIGDAAVVSREGYPADAVAATPVVEALCVPADPVLASTASHPEIARALNAALVEHTHALHEKIRIMTAGPVPKRLATLMLYLAERFGDEAEDGTTIVPVVLSRSELARLVGATVETTIRTISRWQKEGVVETTPDGFRIPKLAALSAVASSSKSD